MSSDPINLDQFSKVYFISDLHIGGDGQLNVFESEPELIYFLRRITPKNKTRRVALFILGDFFDLWLITSKEGLDKLKYLSETQAKLRHAFRKAARQVDIFLIPGNHDYELALLPGAAKLMEKWGIKLLNRPGLDIQFNHKLIRLEHGHRFESFTRIHNFGDPASFPFSYLLGREVFHRLFEISSKKTPGQSWLKNLRHVHPLEFAPYWFFSHYFYRELAPALRYLIALFLVLYTTSFTLLVLAIGTRLHILNIPDIFQFTDYLGPVKYIANFVILTNFFLLLFSLTLSFIIKIIRRDLFKSMRQYGFDPQAKFNHQTIIHQARSFVVKNPRYDLLIFGHLHHPIYTPGFTPVKINHKTHYIANTGCWGRTFLAVPSRFRLPPVWSSQFRLSYLILKKSKQNQTTLAFRFIPKKDPYSLTLLERFSIIRKKRQVPTKPQRIVL